MVEIIGHDESAGKEVTCRGCGTILRYFLKDKKRDYSTDYRGDKDYYNYIDCPTCTRKITVK